MKKTSRNVNPFLLLLVGVALFHSAELFGQKETRDVGSFKGVSLSISGDLYLTQSNETSVVVEASKSDLEKIVTVVENGILKIKTKKGSWRIGDVVIYVSSPTLEKISVSGSGDIYSKGTIKSDEMSIGVSGSGDILIKDLQVTECDIRIAGSGDVEVAGVSKEELEISISGSGDANTAELESQEVDVHISGSGSAKVWATKELDTSIAGSGTVYYKGNPIIDARSSGSGRTVHL